MNYGKALTKKDRIVFEEIITRIYPHMSKISYANSMHAWALILITIILEQEKKIQALNNVVNRRIPEGELNCIMAQER